MGDYASVVATLIGTFAGVTGEDELSVYRSLATADGDVVRVRAAESDDGSVTLNDGADLIGGARGLVLAGDLERTGQRWRLLNPHLEGVLRDDGPGGQEGCDST